MYNYIFQGDAKKNPNDFLIFVKRLMPRWVNCIPDSECIAIFEILKKLREKKRKNLVMVETGCGAGTIAMLVHSAFMVEKFFLGYKSSRGSFLKGLFSESIGSHFVKDINNYWTFIGFVSVVLNIGIPVLKEMKLKADFGFFDSLHTTDHVKKELKAFLEISSNNFVVAFDDAYFNKKHTNEGYINMMRLKLKLKKIINFKNNISKEIWEEAYLILKNKFRKVKRIKSSFEKNVKKDPYFNYFETDRKFTLKIDMEEEKRKAETFIAFEVGR